MRSLYVELGRRSTNELGDCNVGFDMKRSLRSLAAREEDDIEAWSLSQCTGRLYSTGIGSDIA